MKKKKIIRERSKIDTMKSQTPAIWQENEKLRAERDRLLAFVGRVAECLGEYSKNDAVIFTNLIRKEAKEILEKLGSN